MLGRSWDRTLNLRRFTAANLANFHHVAAFHYREEGIIDPVLQTGYPASSRWMCDMYEKYGG